MDRELHRRWLELLGEELAMRNGRTNFLSDSDFMNMNSALHTNEEKENASQLKMLSLDLAPERNRINHHTDDYENEGLIVRRGQEFHISMTFDRLFDHTNDTVILQFAIGSRPKESKKSLIRVKEVENLSSKAWGMKLDETHGPTVHFTVMSPADAIVGEYSLFVETRTKQEGTDEQLIYRTKHSEKLYVLFNAWCKDDAVYMEDESHRYEYVLSDHGRIWVSKSYYGGIPWNFGQFEKVSLETSLFLLHMAELSTPAQANPIQVSRTLSQMANANDRDGGILVGRWTSTYPTDTTSPTEWTGSVEILEKYSNGRNSVKYGQCWVFSGLVTTLLRAIGIPTRSVTNFASAHDTDASLTIDFHFDENGEPLNELNDSVWNFHVWNESFFTRPDLPDGYDGWQAVDSTPQETSAGVYRCGPCPVTAVKNGEVYLPYDTGFVFGEVNGDRVYWVVKKDGEMDVTGIDIRSIGKFISTKAVGSNRREDLTYEYKYPDGTKEERAAVKRAYKFSSRRDENIYKKLKSDDIIYNADVDENVKIGEDFKIRLKMLNTSKEDRHVFVTITTKAAFYTGIVAKDLRTMHEKVSLSNGEEKTVVLVIKAEDYLKMPPDLNVKIFFNAHVQETGKAFATMETVEFVKPELEAHIPSSEIVKGQPFEMTLFFTNPLPVNLTKGVFHIETSRMTPRSLTKSLRDPVSPGEKASVTVALTPYRSGMRYVEASFQSDQLSGVRGEVEVFVK